MSDDSSPSVKSLKAQLKQTEKELTDMNGERASDGAEAQQLIDWRQEAREKIKGLKAKIKKAEEAATAAKAAAKKGGK